MIDSNKKNSNSTPVNKAPMEYPVICRNPNISKDAVFLIDSGLCPCFLGRDSEIYLLQTIIEAINGGNFVFTADDEQALRDMAEKSVYIEMSVGGMREFSMFSYS